jgi:uncharacterized protein (DUF433 family)
MRHFIQTILEQLELGMTPQEVSYNLEIPVAWVYEAQEIEREMCLFYDNQRLRG